jgi:pyruvate/2-oxoglutarate dehydrogenase complex dihydrolipoamide dehydrogenase (E3) component
MAGTGYRTAVVEQKLIGGSCPNVACLPSQNIIHRAKVKSLARRTSTFGLDTGSLETDMRAVQHRTDLEAEQRELDAILADSFPASDAPPWTLGVTSPRRKGVRTRKERRR